MDHEGEVFMTKDRDNALFEAGIKLGALYHQFVGSPINLETVQSLEEAIEKSISLQPYVKSVKVTINRSVIEEMLNSFGYCELSGRMLDVDLVVNVGTVEVHAGIAYNMDMEYPLMAVKEVTGGP
ncbi:MAG: dihydroneopterin aldolase family protein [Halobacteriota archaeon]|nr:dihydroneopterin aldolase family protein [Halobacteriota archaeon]